MWNGANIEAYHICASTFCGSPLWSKVFFKSKPFTRPSLSLSSLRNSSSYLTLSSAETIHWEETWLAFFNKRYINTNSNKQKFNKKCKHASFKTPGGEEIGDSWETVCCWLARGLKFKSTSGSCGGKSKPVVALEMRWQDWNGEAMCELII